MESNKEAGTVQSFDDLHKEIEVFKKRIKELEETVSFEQFHTRNQMHLIGILTQKNPNVLSDNVNLKFENIDLKKQIADLEKWNNRLRIQVNENATKRYHNLKNY